MPTLEEMTAWTPEEIEGAIRVMLPADLQFECGYDREAGTWFVRFMKEDGAGGKAVLFQDWGFEQRLVYFNAYGWMWARQRPKPPPTSPWQRRHGEVTVHSVQKAARARTPDPADLDPEEIQSVYDRFREQPKKG